MALQGVDAAIFANLVLAPCPGSQLRGGTYHTGLKNSQGCGLIFQMWLRYHIIPQNTHPNDVGNCLGLYSTSEIPLLLDDSDPYIGLPTLVRLPVP